MNLARPAGNLTGRDRAWPGIEREAAGGAQGSRSATSRVAVLTNPTSAYTDPFLKEREGLARDLGVRLRVLETDGPDGLKNAFATMASERVGAPMVLTDIMFITHRRAIVELAARHRLPAVYGEREYVNDGGLMCYGANLEEMYRRAAFYVDRILKGVRPADLPIEQPTKFDLVINLKTARALGLAIPPSLLQRADQVIE